MNKLASLLEEAQVADVEVLCSTFFFGDICAKVLTVSHCEKEGANAELSYCDVFDGGASLNERSPSSFYNICSLTLPKDQCSIETNTVENSDLQQVI